MTNDILTHYIFPTVLSTTTVHYYSLGRHALASGLLSHSIGKGDIVLVPNFICRDLLSSIHSIQAESLYYSVDPFLGPVSLPVHPRIKAVIAINYFGFPQELSPFRDYCSKQKAALIEDNAHGFLSRDQQGNLLGTRGDIGIFSFRKTFPLPDGAALIINSPEFVKIPIASLPCRNNSLSSGFLIKRALRNIQNSTGIRVRNLSEDFARFIRRMKTGNALPTVLPESEFEIPGSPAIHCESFEMLRAVDTTQEVNRRRLAYAHMHKILGHMDIEPVFHQLPANTAPYGYPFRAHPSAAGEVRRLVRKIGFECSYWPDLPAAVLPTAPDYYRKVWWVNFLC